ncbi:MAG: efflux RND transporter permease subunit [Verrucomicrobiae bacterium]|jgi:HAE1 family hydrophobic/amphiphilic exporter-1|nr:efflux RND transporter permease subunit [Verrucomicrobiae bacterium]
MKLIDYCIRQPISVAVGVGLSILAGVMAFTAVPVQMKPDVDSVVISISTYWESASAEEIESDVVEEQEKVLSDVAGLVSLTSNSKAGQGVVRLEFETGTDLKAAKADVLQKLDEVPGYPEAVLQPVVEDIDPESVDYVAWVGLSCTDTNFDATTLFDFMERRMKPRFDRLKGVAQTGIRGGRYSELQIRVDPQALAERGLTWRELNAAIRNANANFSGGKLEEGKRDIRIRSTGRFETAESVMSMIIRRDAAGPVYMRDIAEVIETYKEKRDWARARGNEMPFFNFLLRQGGNLIETMDLIKGEIASMNAPGGLLEQHARTLGLNGKLELVQVYDSTTYVADAIELVQSNIVYGGLLATLTLLFFLRSLRTVGIIALAIPISVIAALVVLVMLGRSVNIISLAGMAFAVGMVVDNAIVVIENIFRHLEMGKDARAAAHDGASEVGGAVIASTITTLAVFFPILLIEETAGQLFKDIAYAIMAAVALSLIVSLTVIPAAAARILRARDAEEGDWAEDGAPQHRGWGPLALMQRFVHALPHFVADIVAGINRSWILRLLVIGTFIVGTIVGIKVLIPPLDYLPMGNRNIVFGLLIPPPGYNLEQLNVMGKRVESVIRPAWEAAPDQFAVEAVVRGNAPKEDKRVLVPPFPGMEPSVMPPPIDNYFLVSFEGRMFHGAISSDKQRVKDLIPLLNTAASGHNAPDTIAFAFQMPLFRVGGNTGSAIKIDIKGRDLDAVTASAQSLMFGLIGKFGPYSVNPDPSNFLMPSSELRIEPSDRALLKVGLTRSDVGLAAQANGDGILFFRDYERKGELRDMKVISKRSFESNPIDAILNAPIATPSGEIIDLRTVATVSRVLGPDEIRHVDRARAVTLQFTPPAGLPLETAVNQVNELVAGLRKQGAIAPGIEVGMAGSAGKLNEIKTALLGDGSWLGTLTSSMFLAFFVVYLVLVVLFQSWSSPIVIMLTVPLATLGGFAGLALVHWWSIGDHYMPVQNLDMLSILGFVLLAGVVVNNAILIIHQTINFLNDSSRIETPDEAIIASVRTRVRPILMSSLTSVGGMIPLVVLPGAGSELYRGLGAVVVGGLLVSTLFTLVLVPSVLSVFYAAFKPAAPATPTPQS